jgi:hypothetical protein
MNCDVGNHAVTVISLIFLRLWAYAVNSRMVPWRDQAVYSWVTLIWFTSFHTSGSTMMANKQNMLKQLAFSSSLQEMMSFTQDKTHLNVMNTHLEYGGQCPLHVSSTWINPSVLCRKQISKLMLSSVAS